MSQIEEKLDSINAIDTIDEIDEKLAELKLTKEVPDSSALFALLSGFNWTRKWFKKAEDALLALAYRGESDKPILDFIWRRIVNTDIITFNETFMKMHKLIPIVNHYEIILQRPDTAEQIFRNENKSIIDAVLTKYLKLDIVSGRYLSMSNNDQVLDYLIANPHRIDFGELIYNKAPKAAKFCIKNNKICVRTLSSIDDDEIVEHLINNPHLIAFEVFSSNPNNKAVEYLWDNPRRITRWLSANENDRVVDYLLANPHMIDFRKLSQNKNKRIIDFLIANPDKIFKQYFMMSHDDSAEVAKYLVDKIEKKGGDFAKNNRVPILCRNSSEIAADFIIKNFDQIKLQWVWDNNNDRVVAQTLERFAKDRHLTRINLPETNTCEYKWQKLNAFNAAKMFPRIPNLRL